MNYIEALTVLAQVSDRESNIGKENSEVIIKALNIAMEVLNDKIQNSQ